MLHALHDLADARGPGAASRSRSTSHRRPHILQPPHCSRSHAPDSPLQTPHYSPLQPVACSRHPITAHYRHPIAAHCSRSHAPDSPLQPITDTPLQPIAAGHMLQTPHDSPLQTAHHSPLEAVARSRQPITAHYRHPFTAHYSRSHVPDSPLQPITDTPLRPIIAGRTLRIMLHEAHVHRVVGTSWDL
jgi:hypothetical protein